MKQLLILSGKGGTGKTTIAGAFIRLADAKAYADCDVDAPNLHLITKQNISPTRQDFFGMPKAKIDISRCIGCGICQQYCRYNAIQKMGGICKVKDLACEGCSVCKLVCPTGAVEMLDAVAGDLYLYNGERVFSTAKLATGAGNSGKLISQVKKQMYDAAPLAPLAIVDGSPGIGCPVIASLSGADAVLIVTEPSVSGISDLLRVIATARHFGVKIGVCINKYDTNLHITKQIQTLCKDQNLYFAGVIPYDSKAVQAINTGQSIIDCVSPAADAIKNIYRNIIDNFL